MGCPKHIVNCPSRGGIAPKAEKPKVLKPTTQIIGGTKFIIKPKQ